MRIHVHSDGSEGLEYQPGDVVKIIKGIGYWSMGTGKIGTVESMESWHGSGWRTSIFEVRHSPEWGPTSAYPWMLEPTPETYAKAERVREED